MRRGDVYLARLDPVERLRSSHGPVEGSEQSGIRPVVIVSRDAINAASPVVVVVPLTTHKPGRRLYPSHVVLHAGDGGLSSDSVALSEQVRAISKTRLTQRWGTISQPAASSLDRALQITLDLP